MRLGLDPDELGSPWSAALCSLGAFAAGAVVVVLPYGFSSGWAALIAAIVLASLALFAVGGMGGVRNGRGGLRSATRQLLIADAAALLVSVIGRGVGALAGVQLGGAYHRAATVNGVAAERVRVWSRLRCGPTPPAPRSLRCGRPAPWWRRWRR